MYPNSQYVRVAVSGENGRSAREAGTLDSARVHTRVVQTLASLRAQLDTLAPTLATRAQLLRSLADFRAFNTAAAEQHRWIAERRVMVAGTSPFTLLGSQKTQGCQLQINNSHDSRKQTQFKN